MSKSTRSKKAPEPTADDSITPQDMEDQLRENIGDYFARAEEAVLQRLTSETLRPSRIQAVVDDYLGNRLTRVDESLAMLTASLNALRQEFHAKSQEPTRCSCPTLKDDVAALRDRTKGEIDRLWEAVKALKGNGPNPPGDPEPEEVSGSDDDAPRSPRRKKVGSHTRSRKSRSRKTSSSRRRGKHSRRPDDESSDSSESEGDLSDRDKDDIPVADRNCRTVLSVKTYRLNDRDPERDLGLRTTKVLQNLRHLFDGERFDGSDPLAVLHFLQELKTTFDDAELCEGDARHMVRYFLTGEAARLFKGLAPNEKRSYPRIIKWLLRTYVRESMLQNAREEFLTRSQKPQETEKEYSKVLSDLAQRCAGMIPEEDLINRFVRGLRPAIRTQVQARMRPGTSWTTAVALGTEHGTTQREAEKEKSSRPEASFAPMPRRKVTMGRGKSLMVKPPRLDDDEGDEWWRRDEEPTVFPEPADGAAIGAIRSGPAPFSRSPSYASLPASVTSSEERYYTPRSFMPPGILRGQPSSPTGKKVMLPPGVPFPAKGQTQGNSSATATPCLGCGKSGHWLADCPTTNPRVKDLALEALRTRKQVRQLQFARTRDPSPGRSPRVLLTRDEDEHVNAPPETEERESPPEKAG